MIVWASSRSFTDPFSCCEKSFQSRFHLKIEKYTEVHKPESTGSRDETGIFGKLDLWDGDLGTTNLAKFLQWKNTGNIKTLLQNDNFLHKRCLMPEIAASPLRQLDKLAAAHRGRTSGGEGFVVLPCCWQWAHAAAGLIFFRSWVAHFCQRPKKQFRA